MVSFTCNRCHDVVKKPKVLGHSNMCRSSGFTCVDCMEVFDVHSVKLHTACITEVDKYQGQWKQRCSVNGNPKRPATPGDASDSEVKAVRPRPRMPNLSDSDSENSDWVHGKKSTKRPREEDAGDTSGDRREAGGHLSMDAQDRREESTNRDQPSPTRIQSNAQVKEKTSRPCSPTSTDCVVPTFVLGSASEVADVVVDILGEHPERTSMRPKDLSKELVNRYSRRIGKKSVRHALNTAIGQGKIVFNGEGNICLAYQG